mmetsp:Transcript_38439/g.85607  ORF Transcript_38439/g.85607 Transcript_38439/m.85607 type:complete len:742 (-) Transcript_38439:454-2679(-)|eukprot:CAMPEP_0202910814 /NCGR_PEP_ID=MMETSP1392-20130828/53099_1 /ASSEMBLY_ACC=CAM_ASM_000868 /TAXON_ID=225041 /ORGANISM="Chlamydomonas chlamydogama, Strain SAG 11-48b" /LENGTH=741 /DNA_ID=CAMNT_0049601065 /DNA_START=113 /DNA_END=2338 /DNA_ORIENTATION=+
MYFNRWITFVACALVQSSAGLNYSFSVFAPALKSIFHLDEVQLGTIGTLGFNLGGYLALLAGATYDGLGGRNHVGPRLVLWIGAALNFTGYFGIYALCMGWIQFDFYLLLVFALLAGNAGCWYDTAALVTCIKNFPDDRGTVVGILKAFLGLSATIYTAIYVAGFQPDTVRFVLFLALMPGGLTLALSVFINRVPQEFHEPDVLAAEGQGGAAGAGPGTGITAAPGLPGAPDHIAVHTGLSPPHSHHHKAPRYSKQARFTAIYALVAVLVVFGMVSAIWNAQHHLGGGARKMATMTLLLLLSTLLLVPISAGPCTHPRRHLRRMHAQLQVLGGAAGGGSAGGEQQQRKKEAGRKSVDTRRSSVEGASDPLLSRRNRVQGSGADSSSGEEGAGAGASAATPSPLAVPKHRQRRSSHEGRVPGVTPPGKCQVEGEAVRAGGHDDSGLMDMASELESGMDAESETAPTRNLTPLMAMQTLSFWLIFFQALVGVGTGLTFLNNLASLVVALGGELGGQVVFVSLFSVANASGRLFFGYISEYYLHSRGMPRTRFVLVVSICMAAFTLLSSLASLPDLYPLALLCGMAFGGHWSVLPAVLTDLFGLQHYASIYTTVQLAPACGGYLLATLFAGYMYNGVMKEHGQSQYCVGHDCYGWTWMWLCLLNIAAAIGSAVLCTTTKWQYEEMEVSSLAAKGPAAGHGGAGGAAAGSGERAAAAGSHSAYQVLSTTDDTPNMTVQGVGTSRK